MSRRIRISLAVFVAIATMLVSLAGLVATGSSPATAAGDPEQDMLTRTNQARAASSLPALQWDSAAANVARSWSQYMAGTQTLAHNPNLVDQINSQVTTQWTRIGENVGYGPDTATLQNAFMNSAPHRANILGDYNRVGIGAAYDGHGTLWITLDFIKGPDLGPPDYSPSGSVDSLIAVPGAVTVSGWALDPDTTASIEVNVYLDNTGFDLGPAAASRPDVANAFPGYGDQHGYGAALPATPGWHRACIYALNVGPRASNSTLACRYLNVPDMSPFGSLDSLSVSWGSVSASGWAIDPDTANPINVHLWVDNSGFNLGSANQSRADVGTAFPNFGPNHGFSSTVAVSPGAHLACAYGINVASGTNRQLGCAYIVVPDTSPFGSLDSVVNKGTGFTVSGWTIDPDTSAPISVHVYVDGVGYNIGAAGQTRPDVGGAFPNFGSNHGYGTTISTSPGVHTVCAYGINVAGGTNRQLGCTTVRVG